MNSSSSRLLKAISRVSFSPYIVLFIGLVLQISVPKCVSQAIHCLVILDLIHKYVTTPAEVKNPGKWKAVIAGAGVSGLCMGKRLVDVGITDFVILEKSSGIGGTWKDNVYPGVACDVSSHAYTFSFFPNAWWSRAYSNGKEIYDYVERFASHFDLHKYIRFNKRVSTTCWDDEKKMWNIQTEDGEKFEANFFVHATGGLHHPHKAQFKNQELFKKPIFHTAEWDTTVDLTNKRVAIIGTGASAVQIVPSIAEKVKQLYLFQRTPAWVPKKADYQYWTWVKYVFDWFPWINMLYRSYLFLFGELLYHALFVTDSIVRPFIVKNVIRRRMESSLRRNPDLSKALIPKYQPGCKRITPSDHFLRAMQRENVHLIQDPIQEFTQDGIICKDSSSKPVDVDMIILATGFDIFAGIRSYECTGKQGVNLQNSWGECPTAYLGVTNPGFPNYFILLGPSTALGHSSIIFMIECEVNCALDCITKLTEAKEGQARSIEVRESSLKNYLAWVRPNLEKTIFHSGCVAYYQNMSGFAWTQWPKSCIEYWWSTYSCKEEDYVFN